MFATYYVYCIGENPSLLDALRKQVTGMAVRSESRYDYNHSQDKGGVAGVATPLLPLSAYVCTANRL